MTPSKSTKTEATRYTRFEKARIVGARALQIGMGAPVLIKHPKEMRNPVDLALMEYDADLIPITVQRAPPPRSTLAESNTTLEG